MCYSFIFAFLFFNLQSFEAKDTRIEEDGQVTRLPNSEKVALSTTLYPSQAMLTSSLPSPRSQHLNTTSRLLVRTFNMCSHSDVCTYDLLNFVLYFPLHFFLALFFVIFKILFILRIWKARYSLSFFFSILFRSFWKALFVLSNLSLIPPLFFCFCYFFRKEVFSWSFVFIMFYY